MVADYFMFVMLLFGLVLFVASTMIDEQLGEGDCPDPEARKMNMGVLALGVILITGAVAYFVCNVRCQPCKGGANNSIKVYSFLGLIVFITALVLGVSIGKTLDSSCAKAKNWSNVIITVASVGSASCLGMLIYEFSQDESEEPQGVIINSPPPKSILSQSDSAQSDQVSSANSNSPDTARTEKAQPLQSAPVLERRTWDEFEEAADDGPSSNQSMSVGPPPDSGPSMSVGVAADSLPPSQRTT